MKQKELREQEERLSNEKKAVVADYEDKLTKLSKKFDADLANLKNEYEAKLKEAADRL